MAILLDIINNKQVFVLAHHSIGRLSSAVDTVLPQPQISKHHVTIEWREAQWQICDFSRNGTWLAAQKLPSHQYVRLKKGDTIALASMDNQVFKVLDTSPPCDYLAPVTEHEADLNHVIKLENDQLLPCDKKPLAEVIFDSHQQQWIVCSLTLDDYWQVTLFDGDTFELDGTSWQFFQSHSAQQTQLIETSNFTLTDITFIFELSLDEEETQLSLIIDTQQKSIDLVAHNHHYLLQHLARYRKADFDKGLDEKQQGWVHKDILMQELGIDDVYLSVLVHRARKQFKEKTNIHDTQGIIERQPRSGLLRFAGSHFKINKGPDCQCELE